MDHGGNIYAAARALGCAPEEILDFSASINPLGPSPLALRALSEGAERLVHYPDPNAEALRETIGAYHQISEADILVGNGSAELIDLAGLLFQGGKVLIPQPAFSEYAKGVVKGGGKVVPSDLAEVPFRIDLESLFNRIEGARIEGTEPFVQGVFLCNPNNPTGQLFSKKEIGGFITRAGKKGVRVILDEAFIDYHEEESLAPEIGRFQNLIILRSFTKFFALPGLRIGYAVSDRSTLARLRERQVPWSVNALAQAAAIESLKDRDYIEKSRKWMAQEREWFYGQLCKTSGLRPLPPHANFIFIELLPPLSSTDLQKKMLARKILIRDCASFPGLRDRYIRLAVRSHGENERLLELLNEAAS
jgi:threonine-phosphate decarboxylase